MKALFTCGFLTKPDLIRGLLMSASTSNYDKIWRKSWVSEVLLYVIFQVRVCDGCFEKTVTKKIGAGSSSISSHPSSKTDKPLPVDAKKTSEQRARELKQAEEDEINLAIALSQSEAEAQVFFIYLLLKSYDALRCAMSNRSYGDF